MPAGPSSAPFWTVVRRERTLLALVLGLGVFLLVGAARPRRVTGLSPSALWAAKLSWSRCADMVVGGDSRTYLSVSPAAMKQVLGDRRILNFGFENAGFSTPYLDGLEHVLDPASPARAVLMGITPHSLTKETSGRFTERSAGVRLRSGPQQRLGMLKSSWYANLTEPVPLDRAGLFFFAPGRLPRHQAECCLDGWMATRVSPTRPELGIAVSRGWFEHGGVDTAIVSGLLARVRAWKGAGIRVYAFRPPTTSLMVQYEDDLSGFDQAEFVRRFEEAGGRWLEMDQGKYPTYDSSHLDRDGAVAFSGDLARALATREGD